MEINKIYNEPCLETLSKMDNESIDCVITSPPYWQLRDYGYEGQWGLEPTFNQYLEHLWQMMDEIYRVLKPEGTVWINLGDTYSGSNGAGFKMSKWDGLYDGDSLRNKSGRIDTILSKCLLLIPHRFAIGCIDRGWIMRNDIIWAKRNGMPESVTDRFSKKHEYFFFMVKSEKYFFDLDAIRDKHKQVSIERLQRGVSEDNKWVNGADGQTKHGLSQPRKNRSGNPIDETELTGKNPGSVSDFWDIPTRPSSEKHYASYNDSLLVKPILAGCPEGGIIYDPFMGTGSTAQAAIRANRNFIGSEMSVPYCQIANKRLEKHLTQTQLF